MDSGNRESGVSRRDRERRRSRELILAAAVELFGRRGYQKTSMKEIADRADMSVGKVYSCFEGKEEIYRTLLETYLGEMHRRGDAACLPGDPPLDQLRCRIVAAIEHFKEHLDFLMIYHNESPMLLEGTIRREIEHNRQTAESLLARAMERGELRRMDPSILSAVFVGGIHDLLHLFADRRDVGRFEDVPEIMDRLIIEPLRARPALERKE
jgi:AcrR family transcriptional regulator